MEYPEKLLALFNDPLLDNVRPISQPLTSDDRLTEKFLAVNAYIKEKKRIPQANGPFEEKKLYRSLEAIKAHGDLSSLKALDEYHLLDSK